MADDDNNAARKNKGKSIVTEESDSDNHSSLKLSSESEDDEVQSKVKGGGLLDSISELEKSLPMKRGLSSHYDGKSKSFGDLQDMGIESIEELEKKEHVLNKKQRLINATEEYCNKKQPMDHVDTGMDDGSSRVEIHAPIDSDQNEDGEEKDDKTKNEEEQGKSKS